MSAIQAEANKAEANLLIAPKPSYKYGLNSPGRAFDGAGQNPLPGVILDYVLQEDMDSAEINMTIHDSEGNKVRAYSSKKDTEDPGAPLLKTKKGVNRFNWNMKKSNLPKVKGLNLLQGLEGHSVAPGNYTARLMAGGDTSEVDITILAYPGIKATQLQYNEQYAFLNRIAATFTEVHESVSKMHEIKNQLVAQKNLLKDNKDLISLSDSIVKEIDAWIENLVQPKQKTFQDIINFPNQLNAELLDLQGRADDLIPTVTAGSKKRYQDLLAEWAHHKTEMARIIDGPLLSYNKMYNEKDLPAIIIPK